MKNVFIRANFLDINAVMLFKKAKKHYEFLKTTYEGSRK